MSQTNTHNDEYTNIPQEEITSQKDNTIEKDITGIENNINEHLEKIKILTGENEELSAENISLKKELTMCKLGIKIEYQADAMLLANNLVTEECTFEQALNSVIKKYPVFIAQTNENTPYAPYHPTQCNIEIKQKSDNNEGFIEGIKNKFLGGK